MLKKSMQYSAMLLCLTALLMGVAHAQGHGGYDVSHNNTPPVRDEPCQVGDFGCNHEYYHTMYGYLELITGRSCCHNGEGRPTKNIIDATPEQMKQGFRYRAYVDGMWCPAKEDALMRLSEEQRGQFMAVKKNNEELFYNFLEHDHVFAPKAQADASGRLQCPTIFCIYMEMPA